MVTVLFVDVRDFTRFATAVPERLGDRCRVSVGVNTGLVLVGTVGGGSRFELVLVTEATRCRLERENGLVPRGSVELEGKGAPVPVYALGAGR